VFKSRPRSRIGHECAHLTNVVSDLLAANLIKPLGEGSRAAGAPPDMIRFKSGTRLYLGVQISAHFLSFCLRI